MVSCERVFFNQEFTFIIMQGLLFQLTESPIFGLVFISSMVIALTVHEFAHAKVADMLGDPTPRLHGRLTLNPLAHLDIFGTLFLLFAGFGWGKAVPFDPYNLKDPRRDSMKISLAGPMSNFILAIIASIVMRLLLFVVPESLSILVSASLSIFISLNVVLGVFNLIPIEPLDGFKIVGGLLPEEQAETWNSLRRYGMIFLILVIIPLGPGPSVASMVVNAVGGFMLRFLI